MEVQQAAPPTKSPQPPANTTPLPPPPSPPSGPNMFVVVIVCVILLTVVGAASYILGARNDHEEAMQQKTGTPTPTPTSGIIKPVATAEPTTHAGAYVNSTWKYQVSIPHNWKIEENTNFLEGAKGDAQFKPSGQESLGFFYTALHIVVMPDNANLHYPLDTQAEFSEWLSKPISTGEGQRLYKTGQLKIDGIDAVQYVTRTLPGDPTEKSYSIVTWFRKDNNNYYIEVSGDEKIIPRSQYEEIIATFKFE